MSLLVKVMAKKQKKFFIIAIVALLISLGLSLLPIQPLYGHANDLAIARIKVDSQNTQITLAIPTNLLDFADQDHDSQLSSVEISNNRLQLQDFFADQLSLTDSHGHSGTVTVEATENRLLPASITSQGTHSTVGLTYRWSHPIDKLKINYNLFNNLPNGHCLTTIFRNGQRVNYLFTSNQRTLEIALESTTPKYLATGSLLALLGAFVWGAAHALSPGHGKTLVGAYLVGTRAKAKHALFLALTTTITHTIGVLILGLAVLVASQYFLPTMFLPWLSLISGLMVVTLGLHLLKKRLSHRKASHTHHHFHHHHDHSHHTHDHTYDPHTHSNLPPNSDENPITWGNLLTLGVAGGLVPCPSALVLLLGTISLGQVSWGILLVLVFCLGLAGTLSALGLLLINSKSIFERLPHQIKITKFFPIASSIIIFLVGLGLTYQAVTEILLPTVKL